ncbi:MAG TPA: hypothetical protein VMW87_08280, partial [Spirochaetia bacterium]|nr:hypothetical protein [Spirochaetia bacterium]
MNGYLIFALVATLELASPGTTHFGIDVIRGGILDSQFSVSVEGSVSRFLRTVVAPAPSPAAAGTVERDGPYMQVERSAAFG